MVFYIDLYFYKRVRPLQGSNSPNQEKRVSRAALKGDEPKGTNANLKIFCGFLRFPAKSNSALRSGRAPVSTETQKELKWPKSASPHEWPQMTQKRLKMTWKWGPESLIFYSNSVLTKWGFLWDYLSSKFWLYLSSLFRFREKIGA